MSVRCTAQYIITFFIKKARIRIKTTRAEASLDPLGHTGAETESPIAASMAATKRARSSSELLVGIKNAT